MIFFFFSLDRELSIFVLGRFSGTYTVFYHEYNDSVSGQPLNLIKDVSQQFIHTYGFLSLGAENVSMCQFNST